MKPPIPDASARQQTGGLSPVPRPGVNDSGRVGKPGLSDVEDEIAGLLDRSTQELRLIWHKWHRTEPPFGVSRDLLIRTLANHLQEHAYGGPSAVLHRRLQTLARASQKGALSVGPGSVLKAGMTLVREWRGHTHTVFVGETGFEYEGQRYRSLTVIAERITGTHWSGPRFFGVTKRARGSLVAEAGH